MDLVGNTCVSMISSLLPTNLSFPILIPPDMSGMPYEGYTWILRMIDVNTKWAQATPLLGKDAQNVGYEVAVIWANFGCPCILQCDNGSEFLGACLDVVKSWSGGDVKVIHGRYNIVSPAHVQLPFMSFESTRSVHTKYRDIHISTCNHDAVSLKRSPSIWTCMFCSKRWPKCSGPSTLFSLTKYMYVLVL
jgi:hypothetical protein